MLTSMALYSVYRYFTGDSSRNGDESEAQVVEVMEVMKKNLYTLAICCVYMVVGPALIILNKYILSNLDFPFPIFLSGLGVLMSALFARILIYTGVSKLSRKDQVEGMLWYKRVLPVGFFHACTLAFGNTVYLLLDVGFIQMLKAFTPVVIIIIGVLSNIENPSQATILSILVICFGTAATCSFQLNWSILGLIVMFCSEVTEALRLLMTQYLLQNLKFGVIEGQYVLAPATAFWLFVASSIYEGNRMLEVNAFHVIAHYPMAFLVASLMGLIINFLSYLVISLTSSLTMKVLGSARNVLTIFFGVLFWNEVVTMKVLFGYGFTMAGFISYNISKSGFWSRLVIPNILLTYVPPLVRLQEQLDLWDLSRLRHEETMNKEKERLMNVNNKMEMTRMGVHSPDPISTNMGTKGGGDMMNNGSDDDLEAGKPFIRANSSNGK